MNIREYNSLIVDNAKVKIVEESDEDWTQSAGQKMDDDRIKILWASVAPGSGAPSSVLAGAIQATENLGYSILEAEKLFFDGINHLDDIPLLNRNLSQIFHELNNAKVDSNSTYWKYKIYENWDQVRAKIINQTKDITILETDYPVDEIREQIKWGWIGQICAGAFGTALEGYTRKNIGEMFKNFDGYLKKPSTYNDDITFELALLIAFEKKGKLTTSKDIALEWISLIPFGWSAEDIALKNLRLGIYPPESGIRSNPYREWIGAQMRGSICGMIAPLNPLRAAEIAWIDGEISHFNNGILGEVFNGVMTSLAFTGKNLREVLKLSMNYIPDDSLYYEVISDTYKMCEESNDFETVLDYIEERYKNYNLVHCIPNAAIEVVSIYYGNGDFDQTMEIIGKAGLDVDCNCGQVGNILGVYNYKNKLNKKWTNPIRDTLKTYVRTIEEISIESLVDRTFKVYKLNL